MKRSVVHIVILLCAWQLFAQPAGRRLPPSLERELQLRGGTRISIFSDTLKAKTRIAASIRDTAMQELDSTEVGDSAIMVVDSAVSLSHKLWLDSYIAELPEYQLTEAGPRFRYPLTMLMDTRRRTIPFDSTLPQKMQTVQEREPLAIGDALPLTVPLRPEPPVRLVFDAGIGSVSLPFIHATAFPFTTPSLGTSAELTMRNNVGDASAIRSLFSGAITAELFFPLADQRPDVLIPQLNFDAGYSQLNRIVRTPSDSDAHALSRTVFGASYRVGELTNWRIDAAGSAVFLGDDVLRPLHESSAALAVAARHEALSYLLGFDANYRSAGKIDIASSASPSLTGIRATLAWKPSGDFQIGGGLGFAYSQDAGESRSNLLPSGFLKWQQSPFTQISASVARSMRLVTSDDLASVNPFFALAAADSLFRSGDPRRAALEPLRVTASVEYVVSLVERISSEVRFIMSEDEPVFELVTDSAGRSAFTAKPYDTRKFEAEGKVAFLVFGGDEVDASVVFASSTIANEERSMPFAPTVRASVIYSMKALVPSLAPQLEFKYLARPDKSISLLNAETSYKFSDRLALFVRAENLFNAAGDFWTGYNEYPRNFMMGVKGKF